jgi:AraC-like DNA-binding protein
VESVSRVRVPHPALRAYVESYTGYRHLTAPGIHHGLPSHSLTLVIAFQEPVDLAWAGAPGTRERFWAVASGLHSRPALIHHDGFQYGVQVSLTPLGARALFGIPAAGLARDMVTLDDLPAPLPPLQELLADAPTWPARFDALDEAFLRALARHDAAPPAAEVSQAWWVLHRTHGRARVGDVAAEVGWSRRHLGQRFVDEFGITPKEAARIFRFQHSRRLVTGGCRLAHAAALAGYADQAHLTREWRALAGYAPTEYLREELPFLQDDEDVPVGRSSA